MSGNSTVTVIPVLTAIAVEPVDPILNVGIDEQFFATGTYSDGSTPDVTALVVWASSDPLTATISSTGLVSTLAAGVSEISATLDGVTGFTTLTALPP